MAQGTISKKSVDALKAGAKEEYLWDRDVRGFGVKVTPKGSKSFLVQYRMGGRDCPTKRVTIGKYPGAFTPAEARTEAERLIRLVKVGEDPQEQKKTKQRQAVDLAFDKYAERFLTIYGEREWGVQTLKDNRRYLTSITSPARSVLGKRPLTVIRKSDIAEIFDAVPASKKGYARNLYSALRKLFAWAVTRGDIERSPFEGFEGPKVVDARQRVLKDEELKNVWLASASAGAQFGAVFRLLILTGQRRREVASLKWEELDRDAREWCLPSSRTKNDKTSIVPLNSLAIEELDRVAGKQSWPRKGYVFTSTGTTPVSGLSKAKRRVDDAMLKLEIEAADVAGRDADDLDLTPWRIHDLRRTFATGMQKLGVRLEVTEALLNHVSGSRAGIVGVYQTHDWKPEKRTASDAWALHLAAIIDNRTSTNVVKIRG